MKILKKWDKNLRLILEIVYGRKNAEREKKRLLARTKSSLLLGSSLFMGMILIFDIEKELLFVYLTALILLLLLPFKKLRESEQGLKTELSYGLEALINEINMLLSAGLSLEAAIMKISQNPPEYEVIIKLFEHIEEEKELGFSLYVALASFAKLYKSTYMYRFNAALASSGKTGSSKLQNNLNDLKNRIIGEKRASIKRRAETLSTKLILPLMLSLMGIFGMLLFPIFQQLII